jgi:hypothetical protein
MIAPPAIRPAKATGTLIEKPYKGNKGDTVGLTNSAIPRNCARVNRKRNFAYSVPKLDCKTPMRDAVSRPGFQRGRV